MQNMLLSVSGQLNPEEKFPPVRIGVWVKVRVRFRVGGQPDNCPRDNSARLGLGLGFVLGLGGNGPRYVIFIPQQLSSRSQPYL